MDQSDPKYPLADRDDLPEHERKISSESWDALQEGLESAKRGPMRRVDPQELDDGDPGRG